MEPAVKPKEDWRVEDGAGEAAQDSLEEDQMPHFRRPAGCEHCQTVDGDADPEGGADPVGVATEETDDGARAYKHHRELHGADRGQGSD